MAGEPVEITALRTNLVSITDAVGNNLQWFANSLAERAFITQRAAQGILGTNGITPSEMASKLLDSVFAAIEVSGRKRHRFNDFVAVFSSQPVYSDLVERLRGCIGKQETIASSSEFKACTSCIIIRP